MNALWKKTDSTYISSAKVVDGNLILSLPDAINPIVWRMELSSAKASAFEVKPHATDGTFVLTLKTLKGEVHDIAPFQNREQAVYALMRVTNAMQSAQGRIATTPASSQATTQSGYTETKQGGVAKWLLTLGGVLLVIFLFAYISAQSPQSEGNAPSATNLNGESSGESGVPQSADQMLRGF